MTHQKKRGTLGGALPLLTPEDRVGEDDLELLEDKGEEEVEEEEVGGTRILSKREIQVEGEDSLEEAEEKEA